MKKSIMVLIAAIAMTSMFAQANENAVEAAQDTAVKAVEKATEAAPAPKQEDNNKTTEESTKEK